MRVSEIRKTNSRDFLREIKSIDLKEYANKHYGISSNNRGFAHCPDHPPDNHPSLQFWIGDDGIHRYTDYHTQDKGTIIDFVMKREQCSKEKAINLIKQNVGFETEDKKQKQNNEYYLYKTLDNQIAYRKVKKIHRNGNKSFWFEHIKNGNWERGKGEHELIPYNLPDSKEVNQAIICEGEKDADTVKRVAKELNHNYWVTSAPNGMGAWPDGISKFFKDCNEATFLYDTGKDAEESVQKHALKLTETFPKMKVFVAKVPLDSDGADITDYLNQKTDKTMAFLDILNHVEEFKLKNETKTTEDDELKIETLEEFMSKQIPEIERLIDPYLERYGLTLVGGSKGVGKSLFVTQMALHYSSNQSGFLSSTVNKPGKVLLIQQEVHEAGMQDRLEKMLKEGKFSTGNKFYPVTTTGNQLHLTEKKDRVKIISLIEKIKPDVLMLDPLYTFFPNELNQYRDMSQIVEVLMELKTQYNLSLVVVHHFSNKQNPDEPKSTPGRFMGHSILANAADVTVGIDFLHPRYREQVLPLPYNHYASVDTGTRHGEWPEKLFVERGENQLLFRVSSIWDNIGKKIIPEEILEYINENGGEMFQQDIISIFEAKAHPNTIRKAIKEAERIGKLEKDTMPGKHGKKILRLKQQNQGG